YRGVNAMRVNGIDIDIIDRAEILRLAPALNADLNIRWPVIGGLIQPSGGGPVTGGRIQRRAGAARHDAVAWGYARAADSRGVHIIQNCEVTGFDIKRGRVTAVET